MPIDIPAAIAAITGTIQLAKGLAETSAEIDKAELKLKIVSLVDQLVDAKNALVDARDDIRALEMIVDQLKNTADRVESLVESQGFKYRKDHDGNPTGQPFCPRCLEVDRALVSLQFKQGLSDWFRACPQCKNEYLTDKAQSDAEEARIERLMAQQNRDPYY
jgi:hypothetical protein